MRQPQQHPAESEQVQADLATAAGRSVAESWVRREATDPSRMVTSWKIRLDIAISWSLRGLPAPGVSVAHRRGHVAWIVAGTAQQEPPADPRGPRPGAGWDTTVSAGGPGRWRPARTTSGLRRRPQPVVHGGPSWSMSAGRIFARPRISPSTRLCTGSSLRDEARRIVCGTGIEDGWARGRAGLRHGAPPLSFLPGHDDTSSSHVAPSRTSSPGWPPPPSARA